MPGFCRSVPLAEIAQHGHVLTPGRYVGAEAVENDDEAFAEKMTRLTEQLGEQMARVELDAVIRAKLRGLGMSFEWTSACLSELCLLVGGPPALHPFGPTPARWSQESNIKAGRLDLTAPSSQTKSTSPAVFAEQLRPKETS